MCPAAASVIKIGSRDARKKSIYIVRERQREKESKRERSMHIYLSALKNNSILLILCNSVSMTYIDIFISINMHTYQMHCASMSINT